MLHQTRHHVRGIGKYLQSSYSTHLPPRLSGHNLLDYLNQLGRSQQRIVALLHRSGSRMVGEAANLHIIFVDADDSFHYPDRNIRFIQDATLFDMQFQVAMECAGRQARFGEPGWIPTELAKTFRQRDSVAYTTEIAGLQHTCSRTAACKGVFLIRPDHHLQWTPRRDAVLLQRMHDFDRGHRAQITVEIATTGHGVNVRSKEDGFQILS